MEADHFGYVFVCKTFLCKVVYTLCSLLSSSSQAIVDVCLMQVPLVDWLPLL